MTHLIGGYLPSAGNLNVQPFQISNTLLALGSTNTAEQYIIPDATPILDQQNINACVAFSTTEAFSILKYLETGIVEEYSELFLYWNSRNVINATNQNTGCFIHDALHSLTTLGICSASLWAFDPSKIYNQPPIFSYKQGNDNRIATFYQITSNNEQRLIDIELAIRANHPVIYGTRVGVEFESYRGENKVFDYPANQIGGHAMVLVGLRTNSLGQKEFLTKNSWGKNWGQNGYAWLSSTYLTWSDTGDIFVPTRHIDLLQ